METDDRLRELIRTMQDEARARQVAPPTPEEVLALVDDRLAEADRDRVEEGVAAFPEAARLARALRRFPDAEPAPGEQPLSDADAGARWRSFRRRLDDSGELDRRSETALPVRAPSRWMPALRLAAALIAGVGLGVVGGSLVLPPDAPVNLVPVTPAPLGAAGTRAGEARTELVPGSAGGILLALPFAATSDLPEYALTVYDSEGTRVWGRRGLVRSRQGPFYLVLPPDRPAGGRYRLELSDPSNPAAAPLATYEITLEID